MNNSAPGCTTVTLEGSYYKFIKILDWRFGLHWEHHHEETISRIRRQRFGREVFAQRDDVLIRIENEYAVWEYPVYSDYDPEESKEPIGHIAVVVPLGQPRTAVINGKNAAVYGHYLPFHENGNVLSYPTSFPTNTIQTCIRCEDTFYVGVNPISTWVTWTDVMRASQTESSSLTFELGIDPAIPLVFRVPIIGGIGVLDVKELSGSYSHGQITNHAISFLEESSLFLHLDPIEDENQSYAVRPYFYWDTTGALVVDYETMPVLAPGGFPETWWQSVYARPNLTFNLPWRWEDDDRRELSKEIFFEPATVPLSQTQTVTITARVHNYSLTPAESVAVSFYQQDPLGPFQPIGEDQVVEQIPGRGTAIVTTTAEIHVTTPDQLMSEVKRETRAILSTAGIVADADQHRIYIEVDPPSQQPPHGAVQETNESDNRAYRNLVIKAATAQKGDVSITADDISFQRIENELIKLEANVHAEEGPVAYVLVEFYDGNPQQTGKFIGAVEIPLILSGESELAQISWYVAGQYGDHDIHAVIVFNGEEETNPDNNVASKVIHIAPYYSQVYLPLVLRSP